MVKAKFGDSLRSKTDIAMVNEALCKILCHNICCLIQSMYELGIEATFWGEEAKEQQTEIVAEPIRVVGVLVASDDLVQTLAQQRQPRMTHT